MYIFYLFVSYYIVYRRIISALVRLITIYQLVRYFCIYLKTNGFVVDATCVFYYGCSILYFIRVTNFTHTIFYRCVWEKIIGKRQFLDHSILIESTQIIMGPKIYSRKMKPPPQSYNSTISVQREQ